MCIYVYNIGEEGFADIYIMDKQDILFSRGSCRSRKISLAGRR